MYKGQNYYSDFITNLEKNTTEVKSYSFLSKTKSQDDEDLQLLDYLLPSDAGSTTYQQVTLNKSFNFSKLLQSGQLNGDINNTPSQGLGEDKQIYVSQHLTQIKWQFNYYNQATVKHVFCPLRRKNQWLYLSLRILTNIIKYFSYFLRTRAITFTISPDVEHGRESAVKLIMVYKIANLHQLEIDTAQALYFTALLNQKGKRAFHEIRLNRNLGLSPFLILKVCYQFHKSPRFEVSE